MQDDYISLISNKGDGKELQTRCVYSGYPFKQWLVCKESAVELKRTDVTHQYLSFVYDRCQHTGLLLSHSEEEGALLSVFTIQKDGLSNKTKSSSRRMLFRPNGIFLGDNHVILYGAEVWSSSDRGFTFRQIFSLQGEVVTDVLSCNYNAMLVLLTDQGSIYLMKTGLERFARLNETLNSKTFLLFDHMGILMAVELDSTKPSSLRYRIISVNKLIQEHDIAFKRSIALQYYTTEYVLLHEFVPDIEVSSSFRFHPHHVGKIFSLRRHPGASPCSLKDRRACAGK
ncbi:cation channel sperm-associated protein subunit beta-like [Clupea harengus]|uniref:Cation channel sperm-associated protein subunit beta-like n=1 Tax=Clupea harengus TaxID=7950 RepID=A0A8M1KQC7_CLUHA|nr:cation channel sperm-associated protein subunit beta-like [Clupea harengus]